MPVGGITRHPLNADGDGLRVIHADAWIAVVEKPSGMPSVPARDPREPPSVVDRLRAALAIDGFLEAAHRLDRDTSGLLILARSPEARRRLGIAFERGEVDKLYLAVVEGAPPSGQGTLHLPIARDLADAAPRYRADPILGARAATRWRVLRSMCGEDGRRRSLLQLEPITGRSHQLRVHLAWLGSPIEGDPLYGKRPNREATSAGRERMLLHAASLDFPHPDDGRRMRVESQATFAADVDGISSAWA